tara:strand:+ start:15370 stop:16314 length:945 start_codon:yes stop_codon:yes gene_type:complete
MRFKFILILIPVLSLLNCNSSDNESDNNQKVFRFDVDGVTHDYSEDIADATLYNGGTELSVSAYPIESVIKEDLTLKIGEVTSSKIVTEGVYSIGNSTGFINENIVFRDGTSNLPFELYAPEVAYACDVLSDLTVGEINLTKLDIENKLISGTFSGSLFQLEANGDISTIKISNGVFTNLPLGTYEKEVDTDIVNAKLNNINYVSNNVIGLRTQSDGDKIKLTASDHNFGRIIMVMPAEVSAGNSYALGNDNVSGVFFFNYLTRKTTENSGNSVISITNHDPDLNFIEGNFYIENASITLINGEFSAFYTDNYN